MSSNPRITGVETIKRQTRVAYGWLVVGQSMVAGLAYGLQAVRPLSVTWTAPLQLRYAAVALYKCYMPMPMPYAFGISNVVLALGNSVLVKKRPQN